MTHYGDRTLGPITESMLDTAVAGKTVIIADDTAFVRDRFATALQHGGHTAIVVQSAQELLSRIRADLADIDLIVLDLQLPNLGGVSLVRAIRHAHGASVPILVFSGTITSAMDVRELARLGVVGYMNEYSALPNILPSLLPHLFPGRFNRRASARVVLGIPISYRYGTTIASAVTLNIGKRGVAIRTMSPLEVDAEARCRLRLPGSRRVIETESRVVWSDRQVGMGLLFEAVDAADQTSLDEFIDTHFFSNRKA
jgi:CheY-like chemotaxis protein